MSGTRAELIEFAGWRQCLLLTNGQIELVVTTEVGPRIVFAGLAGGPNLLYLNPSDAGRSGDERFRFYGGHRLWLAPEEQPYPSDNGALEVDQNGDAVTLRQRPDSTGIRKSLTISLGEGASARITHTVENAGAAPIRKAPWAITMAAPGGFLAVPRGEPRKPATDLNPVGSVVAWPYTNMADPRFVWGERHILLRHDKWSRSAQKFGLRHRIGWVAYCIGDAVMMHSIAHDEAAEYADFGCNFQAFVNGQFLEVETLGALRDLAPGESAEHTVHWLLARATVAPDNADIDVKLAPLAEELKRL